MAVDGFECSILDFSGQPSHDWLLRCQLWTWRIYWAY